MKKFFIVLLLTILVNASNTENQTQTKRELSLQDAININVDRFTCQMDPLFYDFVISELFKWVDIVERQTQLHKDLSIIEQIIKLVEKAKNIDGLQQGTFDPQDLDMFMQITQSLETSVKETTFAQMESEWTRLSVQEILEQMRELALCNETRERIRKASQIIQYLSRLQAVLNDYLYQCSAYRYGYNLRDKIQALRFKRDNCYRQYPKDFTGSTRLPPGRYDQSESSEPEYDNQTVHHQSANQDKPYQANPTYQGSSKEENSKSTRLPPGRSDLPESSNPIHDNQTVHHQSANQDKPFQSNPTYQGSPKEENSKSTRLPPGRSDMPESSNPIYDHQTVHHQSANQDKPFQSNPTYQGSPKEENSKSTRLPPGRSDLPESSNPIYDHQTVHHQSANQDKPFQSNPTYQGSSKEENSKSTRLPPGRSDLPESSNPIHDNQTVHHQSANQDKPYQANPTYQGSSKEENSKSTRLPPGRSDLPESSNPIHDNQTVHHQSANQNKPFQPNPNYQGNKADSEEVENSETIVYDSLDELSEFEDELDYVYSTYNQYNIQQQTNEQITIKKTKEPSTRLPPGRSDLPESTNPEHDHQSVHQQSANQEKPFQADPTYQGSPKEEKSKSTRLPPGRSDLPESTNPEHDHQSVHQQSANQEKPFQADPTYQGSPKEEKSKSTRLPPGRSDLPESTNPEHDHQQVHQQSANQEKPFQADPTYQGSPKEENSKSTRLPPGRSDLPESTNPEHDHQSVHQQSANQEKPFQADPTYQGSPKEEKSKSTRLSPGRSDLPESTNPEHDHQSVHQQSANQEKPFQADPTYQGSPKEEKSKSTRLPPGRSDLPESINPEHDHQSVHQQSANQEKPFQADPTYQGSPKEEKSKSTRLPPGRSDLPESKNPAHDNQTVHQQSANQDKPFQANPTYEGKVVEKEEDTTLSVSSEDEYESISPSSEEHHFIDVEVMNEDMDGNLISKNIRKLQTKKLLKKQNIQSQSETQPKQLLMNSVTDTSIDLEFDDDDNNYGDDIFFEEFDDKVIYYEYDPKRKAFRQSSVVQKTKNQRSLLIRTWDELLNEVTEDQAEGQEKKPEPTQEKKVENPAQSKEGTNQTESNKTENSEKKPETTQETEQKPDVKVETKTENKDEVKSEVKPEVQSEVKPEAQPSTKQETKTEEKPEVQVKEETKPEQKPEVTEKKTVGETKTEAKPEVQSEIKTEVAKSEVESEKKLDVHEEKKPEGQSETKTESQSEVKPEVKSEEKKQETQTETKAETQSTENTALNPEPHAETKQATKEEVQPDAKVQTDTKQEAPKSEATEKAKEDQQTKTDAKPELKDQSIGQSVHDLIKSEKAKIDETHVEKPKEEIKEEKSIKVSKHKFEHDPNDPTQYIPPKHKMSTRTAEERKIQTVSTKYVSSSFDGEAADQYEFSERQMLQDADEYGYGFWLRYTHDQPKEHAFAKQTYYFISRLTSNREHKDLTYYGDRTLTVFLLENSFVFSTYDHVERKKEISQVAVLNESIESMWYFISFSYSMGKNIAVGYVVGYGDNGKVLKVELHCSHVPPTYLKLMIGGKHLNYEGFNGQFANIYYDIDSPALIDTDEKLFEIIKKVSQQPQAINSLIDTQIFTTPKLFNANIEADSKSFEPQEGSLIIEEYSIAGWFRWIDDLKVEESNTFQLFNLRSNVAKSPKKGALGDRALEVHYVYGGGVVSTVYFNTYTILNNNAKGTPYISKSVESGNFIWSYVYFGYDNDKMKAYGALIRPGRADEIVFDPIQHRLITKLHFTIGGDDQVSSFNGKIGYVGVYLGPGAFRSSLDFKQDFFFGDGASNVYQLVVPIAYQDDATDPNVVRNAEFDASTPLVDKILIHDDNHIKINGQSEYSFGMWTRWLQTLPKFLTQRGVVHNIARLGTTSYLIESVDGILQRANTRAATVQDQTLAVTISKEAYEFYTYQKKDQIKFNGDIEGKWNYVYFGYKRGLAKGYVQFGVDGEIDEVEFDIEHDFLLEYVEFVVGKSQAPLFNGQMCKIQCQIGPGSFIQNIENLKLFTQNTLPEKVQIHPISRQTLQLIGQPTDEPHSKFQFDKFQGIKEYSISGWVKWSGAQKLGKVIPIISLIQKRLQDLDGKFEQTLQIQRNDQNYLFNTYSCKNDDCSQTVIKEQQFGEYWDQWTYIYYGYSEILKKTFGYVKFTFTDQKFNQDEINHIYVAVFSVVISSEEDNKFIGSMKTWVINVGEGSFREGGFDTDENIKVHFGFISGTDHIKLEQAGQEAHHEETIIECGLTQQDIPLHVQFEQNEKLHLYGISEYGYGFWSRFQHFGNKEIVYDQPQWMGMARLTSQKDYKDFEQPGDRVLLTLMGKGVFHFSTYNVQPISNNVNGNIPYSQESESEWIYLYFSYKRQTQTLGHAVAFTSFNDITAGIQMEVLHNLLQNYLQLTIGYAGKYYPNFNGQITTIRFNLGPGAFIDSKQGVLARIKNKDPKPDILQLPKQFDVVDGKYDAKDVNIQNPFVIQQEAREYSIQLWFRWFKSKNKQTQLLYRLTSNENKEDAKNIGDKVLMLSHIGTALFSTYTLQEQTANVPYECNIPKSQLEVWTFTYFAYSKKEKKIQYYLRADTHENKGLEPILHAVAKNYWLYVTKDGILQNFNSKLAQLIVNFGEGSFRTENFLQLSVYLQGPKLFNQEQQHKWEKPDRTILGQSTRMRFQDQKDAPIESVQEYSVSLWCRFLQAWPERLYKLPLEMQIIRFSSNEEIEVGKIALEDRILAAHLIFNGFQYSTYDLNDDAPNELRVIPYNRLEGQWYYIYMGYMRNKQIASFFLYDGKEIHSIKNQDLLHKPLDDEVFLFIGGETEVPSFQGLLSKIAISFGSGSFINLSEELKLIIDNSYALDQNLKVDVIHKDKHGQQELIGNLENVTDEIGGTETRGETYSSVGEYTISGWFKMNNIQGINANDCQILFRITNNDKEHLNDKRSQGDRTLYASICNESIKLSTYTLSGLKDWNEAKFLEETVQLGHNKLAWIYIYMGYNEDLQEVHALLHLFDEDKPLIFKGVQHFVPHYMGVYVAKDPFTKRFHGEIQKWITQYGYNSFISIQKRGYEDLLINYRALSTNQKYMWFHKEDNIIITENTLTQEFIEEVESVDEYSIGVWTRWLTLYPTTLIERQQLHNIYRLTANKQDADKNEFGDRVLSAFLSLGNYEFSTYDISKSLNAVEAKLPYQDLEGMWTYIYTGYKNGQFYGMVLFREQQKAQHVELQVQHKALTGYAKFVLGAKEFGRKGFHGWLYDPRIFFGQGAFINESQKVVDMVLKLHRKLPVPPLDAEDYKWPVNIIDTTLQDDIQDKKDQFKIEFNDKVGLLEYSYGFWMQNAVLSPEMTDELRGVVRLSTNIDGSDEQYIGDRTLVIFTKVEELIAYTYTLKDPTFESVSHSFKLLPYQWTYVYFGYQIGKARAYVLTTKGPQEQILSVKHAVPNQFIMNVIKDLSHPLFYGKFYGLKVNFGQGAYLENPQELIEKWPYDPKVLPQPEKKEEKVLALNSAKVDRAPNTQHEQFRE